MERDKIDVIFLSPVFTHNIWGGTRIREYFKYNIKGNDIGECWGISANTNGDVTVKEGTLKGKKLSLVWKEHPELFGVTDNSESVFPLLVKIIDAKDDLSIQVHPDDSYAMVNEEGSLGKMECWYILDCEQDSTVILGHNAETKIDLINKVYCGDWDRLVKEVRIKKGDFIQINPGTVHAIKGGVLVIEIEQNSDITYRLYDYNRVINGIPRELHIEKGLDVITVPSDDIENSIIHERKYNENEFVPIFDCEKYDVYKLDINGRCTQRNKFPFLLVSVLNGKGTINGYPISRGEHFIITSQCENMIFNGQIEMICSTIKKNPVS